MRRAKIYDHMFFKSSEEQDKLFAHLNKITGIIMLTFLCHFPASMYWFCKSVSPITSFKYAETSSVIFVNIIQSLSDGNG